MTILQQAAHAPQVALVLLGFSTRGLPEYLPPQLKGIADPLDARPLLIEVAKKMYGGQPFPVIHTARAGNSELFGSKKADPKGVAALKAATDRSEEHTSELQSLMRISYAVFCLNKKSN